MTVNKNFFTDLLLDRSLSLRQLAKRLDILPSQLSLTFSGKRRMQISEAVRIAQILGAPINDVMVNAGIEEARPDRRRCTVVGFLDGEGHVVPNENTERTPVPDGLPADCEAIQVRTAQSAFAWMDSWILFSSGRQEPEELLGRFCRVKIKDGPEVLATIRRGYEPGTFSLGGPFPELISQRIEWAKPILITRH